MRRRRREGLHIDNLESWQRWLLTLEHEKVDDMKDRFMRTVGLRTLEYLHDLTPERTGALAQSMQMGAEANVFEMSVGRSSWVVVGTNVEYAQYVNDGFEQKAGRFVPGEWRNGTFHYIPGHEEGMVLTGKVIEGAHMFEKATEYVEEDIPTVAEFEFRRLYAELFG